MNKSLAAIALNQNMLPQVGEVGVKNEDGTVSSPNQAAQGTQHIVDAVNTNKGIVYEPKAPLEAVMFTNKLFTNRFFQASE